MAFLSFTLSDFWWTLLVGVLGSTVVAVIVEFFKNRRKQFYIEMQRTKSRLYETKDRGDIQIKVNYKTHEVTSSLVVLGIELKNGGKQDILFSSHFTEGIHISNKEFSFLDATALTSKVKAVCNLDENGEANLSWDIFKAGEAINIELAAQYKSADSTVLYNLEDRCYEGLQFSFRSDCIDNIASKPESSKFTRFARKFSPILFLFIIVLFYAYFALFINVRYRGVGSSRDEEYSEIMYSTLFNRYIITVNKKISLLRPEEMPDSMTIAPVKPKSVEYYMGVITEVIVLIMVVLLILTAVVVGLLRKSKPKDWRRYLLKE